MNIVELYRYQNINTNIIKIKQRLEQLEASILSSNKYDSQPLNCQNNSNPTEKIALLITDLKIELNSQLESLIREEIRINKFISSIEDKEIKLIVRMRFLEGRDWEEIGATLNMHRSNCLKKLKKYLKNYSEKGTKQDENKNIL